MDRQKIVTFGEIMLRLTPPDYLRFNQTNLFRASYGGSEANVAVSLANYGLQSEFVTRLPDNRVADACIDDLRRYGVRTDAILRGGKRGHQPAGPAAENQNLHVLLLAAMNCGREARRAKASSCRAPHGKGRWHFRGK